MLLKKLSYPRCIRKKTKKKNSKFKMKIQMKKEPKRFKTRIMLKSMKNKGIFLSWET